MAEQKNENIKEPEIQTSPEVNTDYLTEEIKHRPVNRKKLLRRTVITAFLAVLFGTLACAVFWLLSPRINAIINPQEEPAPITIPHAQADNTTLNSALNPQQAVRPVQDSAAASSVKEAEPEENQAAAGVQAPESEPAGTKETAAAAPQSAAIRRSLFSLCRCLRSS